MKKIIQTSSTKFRIIQEQINWLSLSDSMTHLLSWFIKNVHSRLLEINIYKHCLFKSYIYGLILFVKFLGILLIWHFQTAGLFKWTEKKKLKWEKNLEKETTYRLELGFIMQNFAKPKPKNSVMPSETKAFWKVCYNCHQS